MSSFAALGLLARPSFADQAWIARPLTLPTMAMSTDAAIGIGQVTLIDPTPLYDTPLGTRMAGTGLNLDAALGLPFQLEVGLNLGIRFGASGALTTANAYGRLFDPLSLHVDSGEQSFANPELRIREAFVDSALVAVGFELRFLPGFAAGSANVLVPGVPLRFRVPGVLRIDTGLNFPVSFSNGNTGGVDIPLAVWFQRERFFFGPLSGFFWNNPGSGFEYGGVPSEVDIHAGVGLGYTLGGIFDLKAQVLTTRINSSNWANYIGGGVGVGVVVP